MLNAKSARNSPSAVMARTSPATAVAVLLASLLVGVLIGTAWPQQQSGSATALTSNLPPYPGAQPAECEPSAPVASASGDCSAAPSEPEATDAALAAALAGQGEVSPDNFDALLSGSTPVGGQVTKHGILPVDRWLHQSDHDAESVREFCRMGMCDPQQQDAAYDWVWDQIRGGEDGGIVSRMPLGEVPPKAALCTMLFNPLYKVAFARSTKVGGTSLTRAIGGVCKPGTTYEDLQDQGFCFINNKQMQEIGLEKLGYDSWEALWKDYLVFTLVRNPYDRAGSSYDYIIGRHRADDEEYVEGHCKPPEFEQFCARPYILGVQNMLFGCGDAVHDFYHTEPQAPCLKDADGEISVDYVVRLENLDEDYKGLAQLINDRRPSEKKPVKGNIGWSQKGPLVMDGEKEANRHLAKYEECGTKCFDLVRNYFKDDFALLGYATTEPHSADATR